MPIAIAATALVPVVLATAVRLLLPPRQTSDIAVPRLDATPERVVAAYVDALNAHDCETAESLMVEEASRRPDDAVIGVNRNKDQSRGFTARDGGV